MDIAHLECALQTIQGKITLSEASMNQRESIRWDVAVARYRLQHLQHFGSFLSASRLGQHVSAKGNGLAVAAGKTSGIVQCVEGPLRFSHLRARLSQLHVSDP